MVNQNPEHRARDRIDRQLAAAGWVVQNKNTLDFSAGRGIAVREHQTDQGPAETLRKCLQTLPSLNHEGLRGCQITAVDNLEESFRQDKPRALVQMATGFGKTYIPIFSTLHSSQVR